MIYITGDLHGDLDRLGQKKIKKLKKGDTLIVCGDFGFVWDGSKREKKILKWLGKRKYQVLFIDGTHENFDLLEEYEEVDFAGGRARQISGTLFYLKRGYVFTIEDKKIFAFGGGESHNMEDREKNNLWWASEMPSEEEFACGREQLAFHENTVDAIVTYDTCTTMKTFLDMDAIDLNNLHDYLDEISKTVTFGRWFFGHYHLDKVISPRFTAIFRDVLPLIG